jgi:RHS repeat-associated protein
VLGYDDFDPFGNVLPGRSSNAGTPNDLNKFTGVERDTEGNINLDAFGRRLYDPELGRFYGIDRFHFKYPSLNPFQYAANDPINKLDVNGDSVIVLLNSSGAVNQGHQAILIQDFNDDGNLVWFYYSADGPGDGMKDRNDNSYMSNEFATLDDFANSNDNKKEDGSTKYDQAYMIPTDPSAPETKEARNAANEAVDEAYNLFISNCSHVVRDALNANGLNNGEKASSQNSRSRTNYAPVKKQTAIQRNNPQGSDYSDKIKPKKK